MATSAESVPLTPRALPSPSSVMMATSLKPLSPMPCAPRHVAFRGANKKYLGWTKGGFLRFIYDDLTSPFVKHQVVNEESENSERYVHIKCCFNQKFWRRQDDNSWLIVAGGRSLDRDRSSWSCTLFGRVYDHDDAQGNVRLHLLQSNKLLAVYETNTDQDSSLFARADELNQPTYALQAVSLDLLPEIFALQGDNGKYLDSSSLGDFNYLQFDSTDIASPAVRHQVTYRQADGTMAIKSLGFGSFWESRRLSLTGSSPSVIDTIQDSASDYNPSRKDMLFQPLQVDSERVALLCVGEKLFCRRDCRKDDKDILRNFFSPIASTLEEAALLKVRETVAQRTVHSVEYDLPNIEIHEEVVRIAATAVACNRTTTENTVELNLTRKVTNSRSWSNSESFKTGVKGKFTMGIPLLSESGVKVSSSETSTKEWGETEEEKITLGGEDSYTVKPGVKLTATLVAIQGKISLKFSYVQEDVLTTGERVTAKKNDGLFTGINFFDIHTDHSEEAIKT